MSRAKELAKSSASILASQVVIASSSFIFLTYFARVFSKQEMALYAFVTMLSGWNQLLAGLGLGTLAAKDVPYMLASNQEQKAKSLITSVVVYRMYSVALIALVFFALAGALTKLSFGSVQYAGIVRLLVLISFIMSVRATFSEVQVALQRFQTRAFLTAATNLGQRIFCVFGFLLFGLYGFFMGFLLATIIGAIFTYLDVHKYLCRQVLPFREVFKQSRSYMGLDLMRGALDQVDRPIVAFFIGAETLAVYYIAKRIFDYSRIGMQAIVLPMGLKFGEAQAEGWNSLNKYFKNSIAMTAAFFIPLGFFLIIVSKPLILLYATQKYASSVPIAMAFGFTIMMAAMWNVCRLAGLRLLAAKDLMYQYIASSSVTFLGYAVLLPIIGAMGAPIAVGIGYLAGIFPIVYQLQKKCSLEMPAKEILFALIGGLSLLSLAIPAWFINNLVTKLVMIMLCSCLMYLGWVWILGPPQARFILNKVLSKLHL